MSHWQPPLIAPRPRLLWGSITSFCLEMAPPLLNEPVAEIEPLTKLKTLATFSNVNVTQTLSATRNNLIFGWKSVWQNIVSPAVSWLLSFIEGPSSWSHVKTALILSSALISVFSAYLSPPLFSFLNFFLKRYKLDLLVKYLRYLLFAKEKYLEMIKKNVEYRLPATPKALTL